MKFHPRASARPIVRDDFALPRPSAMAVREYVPGNLIYANGERYTPRLFRLPPVEPTLFSVDLQTQAVREIDQAGGALGGTSIKAMPVCDVEMPHLSNISDDEAFRFELPVMIARMEQKRHDGGAAYKWGETTVLHRQNVHMRLVNLGPQDKITQGQLGYPVVSSVTKVVHPALHRKSRKTSSTLNLNAVAA